MLARTERDGDIARHLDAEHMLGVVGHAGRIARAPGGVDLVDVRQLPVAQVAGGDAGFLGGLAGLLAIPLETAYVRGLGLGAITDPVEFSPLPLGSVFAALEAAVAIVAALIARDQTSKATAAINRARMQGLGVRKFKWLHSGGGKEPRPLHKNTLNGNVYSMDDPPVIDEKTGERGIPGALVSCRCLAIPVITFGDESDSP